MTGRLNHDTTKAAAAAALEQAQRTLEAAVAQLREAHGFIARLYIDADNEPVAPPRLTVVRNDM